MNDAVLPYLRCPNCSAPLSAAGSGPGPGSLRCARGHNFDIAKQGYATLTAGRSPHVGDSPDMVADRAAFLNAGHYAFIADALTAAALATPTQPATARLIVAASTGTDSSTTDTDTQIDSLIDASARTDGLIVDAGTGTGYYLARVLDEQPAAIGLGLDVSKPALRRAARAHPRASAALADLWRPLPLADASARLILNVFAPRNGLEFRRVLRPDGLLLVVTPAADHLAELVDAHDLLHVEPDKADRVQESLGEGFAPVSRTTLRRAMQLSAAEIRVLVGMTPSARHVSTGTLATADRVVTAAVDLTVYRPA
jgi:23S rRNA (guanine745-N1)-methyltransferase